MERKERSVLVVEPLKDSVLEEVVRSMNQSPNGTEFRAVLCNCKETEVVVDQVYTNYRKFRHSLIKLDDFRVIF